MNQRLVQLSERLRQLKANRVTDCSEWLRTELHTVDSIEEKMEIYNMLTVELQDQNRLDEAEAVITECINLNPDLPDGWISLALHFHYHREDLPKALAAIDIATDKAKRVQSFVRHAYLERIRIAISLKAYEVVEDSLTQLLSYVVPRNSLDVRLETDFLNRIPVGVINDTLMSEYRELAESETRANP
jgi:hypothetical protein